MLRHRIAVSLRETIDGVAAYIGNMRLRRTLLFLVLLAPLSAVAAARASDLALVGAKIYPSPGGRAIDNGAGLTFGQILASLTTNPAQRFGFASRSGQIAAGIDADPVVLNDDPAREASSFSRVRYAIRSGRVIYSEK